jgi:hypothetical protein
LLTFYFYSIFSILRRLRQFAYYFTIRLYGSVVTNSDLLDIFLCLHVITWRWPLVKAETCSNPRNRNKARFTSCREGRFVSCNLILRTASQVCETLSLRPTMREDQITHAWKQRDENVRTREARGLFRTYLCLQRNLIIQQSCYWMKVVLHGRHREEEMEEE